MRFSIIVPAYNAEKFIQRCAESVLKQTYEDFELLIVNDGSKDDTLRVCQGMQDPRVRVLSQENQGVSVARNTGIQNANGEYICFLDADDEFMPNHLQTLEKAICTYPDKGFFVTNFSTALLDGSVLENPATGAITYQENPLWDFIKNAEVVWTGCVCIKRSLFDVYGMFAPGVPIGEDRDMWIRIFAHTGVVFCDEITVKRNRDGSEATKFYQRRTKADILNRLPGYLADPTISADVKKGLMAYYECEKLVLVRSFLFNGNKKEAYCAMKQIDKKRIPFKRLISTGICFFVPSAWIRWVVNYKNRGMFR